MEKEDYILSQAITRTYTKIQYLAHKNNVEAHYSEITKPKPVTKR